MLFNSIDFIVFFVIVLALYRVVRPLRWQNLLLLVASYMFYGAWDVRFLGLLVFSTVVDYVSGLRIEGAPTEQGRKRWLIVSMVSNLGLLGFFKYWDFGVESMAYLLGQFGLHPHLQTLGIILPVGISFYTFQSMSYTIDVYRRELTPTRDFLAFALYVSYFPQLVAGPIERSTNLLPQITKPRRKVTREDVRIALLWILLGYFKKVVLADTLGLMVDHAYRHTDEMTGAIMYVAGAGFAVQVYCDFAGYTLIARGVSRLLGIDLMRNFRMPFLSRTTNEAWQRWHISLSTWLRDYLYIPLGGSRGGRLLRYRNLMLTMLLGGLWHGASWPKVFWGGWNGTILVVGHMMRGDKKPKKPTLPTWIRQTTIFMILWITGLVIFRSRDMDQAFQVIHMVVTDFRWTPELWLYLKPTLAILGLLYAYHIWQEKEGSEFVLLETHPLVRTAAYSFMLITIAVVGFRPSPFIYFQF
ncbi:MAG TPA: MBOAT family protein [Planctomycetes bacterium]|nr:MBOAT family protein [Planctomycetota bacterium]